WYVGWHSGSVRRAVRTGRYAGGGTQGVGTQAGTRGGYAERCGRVGTQGVGWQVGRTRVGTRGVGTQGRTPSTCPPSHLLPPHRSSQDHPVPRAFPTGGAGGGRRWVGGDGGGCCERYGAAAGAGEWGSVPRSGARGGGVRRAGCAGAAGQPVRQPAPDRV